MSTEQKETVLSQHDKFRRAKAIIEQLPSLASEVGMDEFKERMDVMKQLHSIWARGGKAVVTKEVASSRQCFEMIGKCKYSVSVPDFNFHNYR